MKIVLFLIFTLALARSQNIFKLLGCTQALVQAGQQCSGQDSSTVLSCIGNVLQTIRQPDCKDCICEARPDLCGSSLLQNTSQKCVDICSDYVRGGNKSDPGVQALYQYCLSRCKF